MSSTLWLINPHSRGTTGRAAKMAKATKPRTAAQKAATAKLVAANKKRRAAAGQTVAATSAKAKAKRSYSKATPAKKVYKRNPIGSSPAAKRGKGMFEENIKPAALGAAAALGFDIVWGRMTFVPANLRAGNLKYPVKALAAIGLGVAAEHFLPKQHKHYAATLVRGPLTVILHDAGKDMMQSMYPSLALAAYEQDQMAEIIHEMNGIEDDEQVNGYQDEPEATPQVGEMFRLNSLESLGIAQPFHSQPQYHNVAY